jgi:hypothetical protein
MLFKEVVNVSLGELRRVKRYATKVFEVLEEMDRLTLQALAMLLGRRD